jgi:hypothetical protein
MEPIDIKSVGVAIVEDDEPMKVVETVDEPEPEPVVEPEPIAEPEPEHVETFPETSLQHLQTKAVRNPDGLFFQYVR